MARGTGRATVHSGRKELDTTGGLGSTAQRIENFIMHPDIPGTETAFFLKSPLCILSMNLFQLEEERTHGFLCQFIPTVLCGKFSGNEVLTTGHSDPCCEPSLNLAVLPLNCEAQEISQSPCFLSVIKGLRYLPRSLIERVNRGRT